MCVYVNMCVYIFIAMNINTHVSQGLRNIYIYVFRYMYRYVSYIYKYVYIHIYIYICIYISQGPCHGKAASIEGASKCV